jgi:PknH-like extracellular domain
MSIHPNPRPSTPASPAPWTPAGHYPPTDQGTRPAGPRGGSHPDPWAPAWHRPLGAAMANTEEATTVLAHRVSGFGAHPHPPVPPFPPGIAGWPHPAYPPTPAPGGHRRTWAWVGGSIAAVLVATIGTGLLITTTGGADTTPMRSAPTTPPDRRSPATEPTPTPPRASTVSLDALPGLLLDAGTVNRIEGATDIRLIPDPNPDSPFTELTIDKPECDGIQHPAQVEALRGSGYLGVRNQTLDADQHFIAQAVIDYPSAAAATKFAAQQADNWTKCNGTPITLTSPAEGTMSFSVGTVTNSNGMLSVVFMQEGARGWGCQRALTTRNNVVIDTRSCGFNRTDQATTAASRMADRVNSG